MGSSDSNKDPSSNDRSFYNFVQKLPYTEVVYKFMDEQRMERLKDCNALTTIYRRCMDHQRDVLNGVPQPVEKIDMEKTAIGLRMTRLFNWREDQLASPPSMATANSADDVDMPAPSKAKGKRGKKTSPPPVQVPSCARELHCMWNCRAVALACSRHVEELKSCFEHYPKGLILAIPEGGYEIPDESYEEAKKRIPCLAVQQKLAKCVNQAATELVDRTKKREQNK